MNAVERLQAAIEKLEALRRDGDSWERYGNDSAIVSLPSGDIVARNLDRQDGPLIVTLHRTIDAQLAILRKAEVDMPWLTEQVGAELALATGRMVLALALADAILGGAS